MAENRFRSKSKSRRRRFYKRKAFWFGLFLLATVAALAGWTAFDVYARPYRERAAVYDLERIYDLEVPSLILDRNGREIGRFFVENRSIIPYAEIPKTMIDALTSGEDQRYYRHKGVDYVGIVRAGYLNWHLGELNQGASTITQQLARNAYNLRAEALRRGESGMERKLVEAFLALRIEQRYSKEQILEFYLNRIYFGSGFHGLRSAALGYFGKEPRDLSTVECATLVGLIKNPTNLSPLNNPGPSRKARDRVLVRLREDGKISAKEERELCAREIKLNPRPLQRGTSHFYERIADEVRRRVGEEGLSAGGYRIYTTIDRGIQEVAERALKESLDAAEARKDYSNMKHRDFHKDGGQVPDYLQGAVLMVDHGTGEVLAYVGGRDYAQVPFDFIDRGRRPAGTAFLPFVYAAGFQGGLTPVTMVADEAMDNRTLMVGGTEGIVGEWGMETRHPAYEGEITARRALEMSKVAASVRFGNRVGLPKVVASGKRFGFRFPEEELLPRLLVGWEDVSLPELVRAYAAFGRGGELGPASLEYLDRIEDAEGGTVYRRVPARVDRPLATDSATAYLVHSMLNGSLQRGNASEAAGKLLQQPFPGGGKTGTTHDFSDNWFVGYNSRIACGVWVGFLQGAGKPIYEGAFSKELAMPVWIAAMNAARPSFGGEALEPPVGLEEVPVCRVSGQRWTRSCYETTEDAGSGMVRMRSTATNEWFRKGGPQVPFCTIHTGDSGTPAAAEPRAGVNPTVLGAVPIRPRVPVLLGDDPYDSESVVMAGQGVENEGAGLFPRRAQVVESTELGDEQSAIRLQAPGRLEILQD